MAITSDAASPLQSPSTEPADQPTMPRLLPISVEKYHAMIDAGILTETDRCELIEGLLVEKTGKNRLHSFVTGWLTMVSRKGNRWLVR